MLSSYFDWVDPYVDWLAHAIVSQSALAPLFLLLFEEAGVPLFIPGDTVLAYVGYQISISSATPLWLAVCVALVAVLIGSTFLFFASRLWGHIIIEKVGKFIFLKKEDLVKAEKLFQKYGAWTIIFGRHIPGMRIPLTIFAGTSGMRYRTFIMSTFASTIFWVFLALSIGLHYGVGLIHALRKHIGLSLVFVAFIALVIASLHFIGKYKTQKN